MNLAVDFDETIGVHFKKGGFASIPSHLVPGAFEGMTELKAMGHHLTVWSGRNNSRLHNDEDRIAALRDMERFLRRHKIPYDGIDEGDQGKLIAHLYIDNRAVGVPLISFLGQQVVDWPAVVQIVRLIDVRNRLHGRE
jgi:hypothetical protein